MSAVVTATPKTIRSHLMMAEIEADTGYRYWSKPMPKVQLDQWVNTELKYSGGLSDYCCSSRCWCAEDDLQ